MANEREQQPQVYDSTLKEWIQQQPADIIAVLLPGAIYQETLDIKTKRGNITTFNFKTLPLFMLEAEQFIREHVSCMYPLLPTMRGTNTALIQQAMDELAALYREDEITLSQQLIWMEIFLARTDTVPQPEKYKIQEKLDMYDKLWEENPKVQKIRAESEAKGKVETLQNMLVTTIELRFPALSDLAKRQVLRIQKPDALDLLFRQITVSSDENFVRSILTSSVAA